MQVPRYAGNRRYGFNMTPMIDVVFLLIIFFLVSSHLARQDSQLQLPLPIAVSSDDDQLEADARLTVNVDDAGQLFVAGRPVAVGDLKQRFSDARQQQGKDLEVRIRGSRHARYAAVEPIMLACTQAGIWNVTYAVYRTDPEN